MSYSHTTTNLGLPQFQSGDIPTWDDVNTAFSYVDVLVSSIAPKFDASHTYAKGDIVLYERGLYKANKAHTGAWAAADFDAMVISNNLESTDMTGVVKYTQNGSGITANQYAHLTIVS